MIATVTSSWHGSRGHRRHVRVVEQRREPAGRLQVLRRCRRAGCACPAPRGTGRAVRRDRSSGRGVGAARARRVGAHVDVSFRGPGVQHAAGADEKSSRRARRSGSGRCPRRRTAARSGRAARAARRGCRPRSGRPSSTTAMRSQRAAVERRCATTTTVRPSVSRLQRALDRVLGAGVEVRRRLVEHEHASGRRARRGPATRAASPPPTAASPRSRTSVSIPFGNAANDLGQPERGDRVVDLGVGRAVAPDADVVADRSRRRGTPPGAPRRCARAGSRTSRRAGRRRRSAPCPRAGRRSGPSAWRASTCPRRSGRRARAAPPARPSIDTSRSTSGPSGCTTPSVSGGPPPYANATPSTSSVPRCGQVHRARLLVHRRVGVEQGEQLVQRGARRLHRVVELAELLDRLEQVVEVQHEREHGADRDDRLVDEQPADADDHRDAEHAGELDEREVLRRDAHRLEVRLVLGLVRPAEAADPAPLAGRTPARRGRLRAPPAASRGSRRSPRAPRGRRRSTRRRNHRRRDHHGRDDHEHAER